MNYQVFFEPPADFLPCVEVAGCYLECKGKVLFLKRHSLKPQGGTWGVPAGKIEKGETTKEALIREVYEEVGIEIHCDGIQQMGQLFMRLSSMDYVFHLFVASMTQFPSLTLALDEHEEWQWVTVEEALQLPLIKGGEEALNFYQRFKKKLQC